MVRYGRDCTQPPPLVATRVLVNSGHTSDKREWVEFDINGKLLYRSRIICRHKSVKVQCLVRGTCGTRWHPVRGAKRRRLRTEPDFAAGKHLGPKSP